MENDPLARGLWFQTVAPAPCSKASGILTAEVAVGSEQAPWSRYDVPFVLGKQRADKVELAGAVITTVVGKTPMKILLRLGFDGVRTMDLEGSRRDE